MSKRTHVVARQRRREHQRKLLFGIIACVLILAAVVAIVAQRNDTSTASNAAQTHAVTLTGAALPSYDSTAATDPAVGTAIPTVSGTSLLTGAPVKVTNDGKPKVLLFVAHWCPHCQREVPLLAADLNKTPLPAGVEMYTISTGVNASAPNYPPSRWLTGVKWPTPVLADDANSTAAQSFGLSAYPYFVFVDAQNHVVARSSGEMPLAEFRSHVAALQAE